MNSQPSSPMTTLPATIKSTTFRTRMSIWISTKPTLEPPRRMTSMAVEPMMTTKCSLSTQSPTLTNTERRQSPDRCAPARRWTATLRYVLNKLVNIARTTELAMGRLLRVSTSPSPTSRTCASWRLRLAKWKKVSETSVSFISFRIAESGELLLQASLTEATRTSFM
ncbi:hypothetical protein BDP67DRAFT_525994 [Colletotrichum lupini]|nr:hypothetical protein BDP67DRAFT_525994 [Colletotrichum lupini]